MASVACAKDYFGTCAVALDAFPKDTVIPIGHMGSVIQRHLPELIRISGTERKVCIYSLVNIQLIRVL